MKATVSFGRVGGIPVGAQWSALVGVVLLGALLRHVLVRWFQAGTAATERTHGVLAARLGGLRAGDVMTPRPYLAPGWWTVQTLVKQLLEPDGPRHRVFPVVDFQGRLVGRLHLAEIAAIEPTARLTTAVAEVARPVPAELVVDIDTPLDRVQRHPHRPGHDIVVVQHDGRVVGLIATTDLQRAAELEALRSDATGHCVPWNGSIGWE